MRRLTDRQITKLPRRAERYSYPDPQLPGHVLRVSERDVTYNAVARRPKNIENGRVIWKPVGHASYMLLEEARGRVREIVRRIRLGLPLDEAPQDSVTTVAEKWLQLVVKKEGHRTGKESERKLRKYLLPRIGDRVFTSIGNADLARVHDEVAKDHGDTTADHTIKLFRAIASWWSTRDDHYQAPVTPRRRHGKVVKRSRILSDDEIRAVWLTADSSEFRLVQFALVCGQRYGKIASMTWDDVRDGVWTIRQDDAREKSHAGVLPLPDLAMCIIEQQPRIVGRDTLFGPMHNRTLARLRALSGTTGWTVHDGRRTWRTLASRAGVPTEISELTLGHRLKGIQAVYDQFQYTEQKARALATVAQLIERILSGPTDNVVTLGAASC
jgi:integrase